jgi:hypothetical protein
MKKLTICLIGLALIITLTLSASARMTTVVIGGAVPAVGGFSCSASGDLLEETFDTASGYDDADWTEGVSSATLDEDLSAPAVTGFNGQCLRAYTGSAWGYARAINGCTDTSAVYFRTYFYIQANDIPTSTCTRAIIYMDGTLSGDRIDLCKDGSNNLYLSLKTDSSERDTSGTISIQTSYLLEIKMDNASNAWEWKLDGASLGSGSSPVATNPCPIRIGVVNSQAGDDNLDIYWDNVGVSSSGWLGSCQ